MLSRKLFAYCRAPNRKGVKFHFGWSKLNRQLVAMHFMHRVFFGLIKNTPPALTTHPYLLKIVYLSTNPPLLLWPNLFIVFFFFYLGFLTRTFTIHRHQGKGEAISLSPLYHFHPLHRHLDINRAITAESWPLHIASSRTRTGNLWFPSASR